VYDRKIVLTARAFQPMALNGGYFLGSDLPQDIGLQLLHSGAIDAIELGPQKLVALYLSATVWTCSDVLSDVRRNEGSVHNIRREVVLARVL
jgi:hypothetical protein